MGMDWSGNKQSMRDKYDKSVGYGGALLVFPLARKLLNCNRGVMTCTGIIKWSAFMKRAMTLMHFAAALFLAVAATTTRAETIQIRIGHQSMCTDTYPGGVVVKNLHLLEKFLPHTGKYAGVTYDIEWRDYPSGAPITTMMLADKLDFGVMGDYPLIVNGAKFQQTPHERSLLITGTAYNMDGAGNGIVVPTKSNIYSVTQLKGKTISVPIGSAAWGMLYKMAQDTGMKMSDFNIVNQGPMEGISSIAADKVDAHADFCPMSEYMEYNGTGRMIYSGAQTDVPYLHGVVVRQSFAQKYPEIVVAYIKAIIAADQWIAKNPEYASTMMSKWTMIPKEVLYLYYSKGGYLTPDPTLKPQWVNALEYDHTILAKYAQIPPLDFKQWVSDSYIRQAYKEMGLNYDAAVKALYNPIANVHRHPEIWPEGGAVAKYSDDKNMLAAVAKMNAAGKKIGATYVYDAKTGLKLFGNQAFYVKEKDGSIISFMRKSEADNAARQGGVVMTFTQAVSLPTVAMLQSADYRKTRH